MYESGVVMTATRELRAGDVVMTRDDLASVRRVFRGLPSGTDNQPRTIQRVSPDPFTKWEYRKPATSARWSLYFTDGTYAGSTLNAQWTVIDQ